MLNDLGTTLTPSFTLITKLYVIEEETTGSVPEITPVF
jgi:hypothetical protein